ncbi:nucleoside hydrolase [Bifidobacterium sp.]|jgi:inosine-uridine nucleoside N-ribohydrolase|uniref:nucleoside hydrolase n=1 Tax=Bifidobacterium sp. TaxID=41200 RepID=UPI0025C021D4|nr:nucleoside hydrolase [Bifidobacterium sp.]MCH4160231.1 nucleoside hydrolase [Bifidobacterium sp.]MCH4175251.1 nucleoside hydrolase [Bifidobacterium sp.]MCI1634900.1 nucleoside hydrolase [Bifidobacterium sp.]
MFNDETMRSLLAPPKGRVTAILDSDTYNEVDDQFALAYAASSPDRIKLIGVNAAPFLNARVATEQEGMERSYQEIQTILKLIHHEEIPSYRGSEHFMESTDSPVDSEAARNIVKQALAMPDGEPLYIIAIGAPTNIASALLSNPEIAEKIVVLWLGGHPLYWPQTWEFNLMQDMPSSKVLFDSGVPLITIPCMSVASALGTTATELAVHLKGKNEIGTYLTHTVEGFSGDAEDFNSYNEIVNKYLSGIDDFDLKDFDVEFNADRYAWSKVIWDIATVAYLVNPGWVYSRCVEAPVLNDDFTWGERLDDKHLMRTAYYLNRDAIFGDLFYKISSIKD